MFRNKVSKVATWPYLGPFINICVYIYSCCLFGVFLHLDVVHSLDFKGSYMDIEFQSKFLFPFFLVYHVVLLTGLSCGLMLCLFYLIIFHVSATIIGWISLHLLLFHVIRQTAQPNFLSCHPVIINWHTTEGKKTLLLLYCYQNCHTELETRSYNFLQNIFHNIHGRWRCKKYPRVCCHL